MGAAAVVGPFLSSTANANPFSYQALVQDPIPEPGTWEHRHQLYDYDRSKIHTTNFLLASHPLPVREAIARHAAEFDANPSLATSRIREKTQALQKRISEFFICDPDCVAPTSSTIDGIYLFWEDILLNPSDEVIVTTHDHPDMLAAIKYRSYKTPLKINNISLYELPLIPTNSEIVARMKSAITSQTRVIISTWVHSSTGVKLPIGAIGQMIKDVNQQRPSDAQILFVVDGVHGFAIETDSFADLNCDFFISGTHKWLSGPRGTGMVVGTPQAWKRLARPAHPDNRMNTTPGRMYAWNGYFAYEHRFAVIEAMNLQVALGRTRIRDHVHGLSRKLKIALSKMNHIQLHTPIDSDQSAGIICFDVHGMKPSDFVIAMAKKNIVASGTPYTPSYSRIGLFHTNTDAEVDQMIRAIQELA